MYSFVIVIYSLDFYTIKFMNSVNFSGHKAANYSLEIAGTVLK